MSREEFAVFVSAMRTYYGRENLLPNNLAMELWYAQLQDIPYEVAEASLNKWVATNRFSPSIAEIRQMAAEVTMGEGPDWGDAWEQVKRAISRFGYNRQEEAMASLDDTTREAVRRVGWYDICMSETPGVERASFRDIYNSLSERKRKEVQLPPGVITMIEEIQRGFEKGGLKITGLTGE